MELVFVLFFFQVNIYVPTFKRLY